MSVIGPINSPIDPTPYPAGTPLIGYDNVVKPTNIFASTAAADFPVSNLGNPATHLYWQSTATVHESMTIVPGVGGKVIDYIAIAGHNLGSSQIPITISNTGVSPGVPIVLDQLVPDDKPVIFRFPAAAYTQLAIDMSLNPPSPSLPPPRMAVVYCGKLLIVERGVKVDVTHTPITMGRKTNVVGGMPPSASFLGRIVLGESRMSRAEFFGFTPDFYRASVDPFLIAAQEVPFFWAWAPQDYPLETGYAWLTGDPQPQVSPDHLRVALSFDMTGIA